MAATALLLAKASNTAAHKNILISIFFKKGVGFN